MRCVTAAAFLLALFTVGCGGGSGRSPTMQVSTIDSFALTSYRAIDPTADPKGGGPVYVVDSDITVRAHTTGIDRVDVHAYRFAIDPDVVEESATPDEDGWVTLSLRLPEPNTVYVVDSAGILTDQSLESVSLTNESLEKEITGGAFRVIGRSRS